MTRRHADVPASSHDGASDDAPSRTLRRRVKRGQGVKMIKAIVKILIMTVLSMLLVSTAFLGGYAASRSMLGSNDSSTATTVNDGAPPEFRAYMPVFWEAWNLVKENFYVQPIDEQKAAYGAISGMVESLGDPHTAFLDPKRAEFVRADMEGSFEGIGATVGMNGGRLTIIAPIKGSPAEKAGLKPGDVILQVDDKPIVNMDLMEAIALIRGKKGTPVKLRIQRGTNPAFDVTIIRATIEVPSVETKMLEGDTIAYIQLNEFGAKATSELTRALQETLAKKPRALIFDLRGNPGGFLPTAVEVASQFIKGGQVVLIEEYKDGHKEIFKSKDGGLATEIPMVLLVNEGSASASEILAAVIKDYQRAIIIGKKTFGKGSVQLNNTLSDNSQLRVTVAHFLSPKEHPIEGVGITPDIEVDNPTEFELSRGQDPQLQRAIDLIKSGELKPASQGTSSYQIQPTHIRGGVVVPLEALQGRIWYNLAVAVLRA